MTNDDAWKATTAVAWYVANQPFDVWFLKIFPDHKLPPLGQFDYYKHEWLTRWHKRDIGQLFGHLDFEHQQRFIAEVLRVYDEEVEKALGAAKARLGAARESAGSRPSPAEQEPAARALDRLSNDPNLSPSYRAALRDAGRGHLVR